MTAMQKFSGAVVPFHFDSAPVRVVSVEGEAWFVAKDVAAALGYVRTADAVRAHCKAACPVGVGETPTPLDPQTIIIPERDVYRLVMRSKLPAAERFEEWVVGEVLPSIRKSGSYNATPSIPQSLPEALRLAADLAERNTRLQLVVTEQAPKVDVFHRIADAAGTLCLTDAAKHLGIQRKRLIRWLQENRWIYQRTGSARWLAYQPRLTSGVLVHRIKTLGADDHGDERVATQVRITTKGLIVLAKRVAPSGGV